jgi:hypothetical protein
MTDTSTSPVVTVTTVSGFLAGILTAIASLAAGWTGHAPSLEAAIGALAGAGISLPSVLGLVFHHNKALEHDAAIAIHDVPQLDALKQDVETAVQTAGTVDPKIAALTASLRREIGEFTNRTEQVAGVTPEQVKALVSEGLAGLTVSVGAASNTTPTPQTGPQVIS